MMPTENRPVAGPEHGLSHDKRAVRIGTSVLSLPFTPIYAVEFVAPEHAANMLSGWEGVVS